MADKFFKWADKIEYGIAMACISGFTIILFIAAVFRAAGHPISWDNDVALFLLAWATFLGGDVAFRSGRLVNTGILIERLPVKLQKAAAVLVYGIVLAMLAVMIYQGIRLWGNAGSRKLEGVPFMSYSWVVLSVPVSFSMMFLTALYRLAGLLKSNDPAVISKM